MSKQARHATDPELIAEGLEGERETLELALEGMRAGDGSARLLLSTACDYAGYLAVAESGSPELCRALRLGAKAAAACFALAAGHGEVEIDLGELRLRQPATGPDSMAHVGVWTTGWWLAQLVRDGAALAILAETPIGGVLRRSSTRGSECQYLFAEVLQGFGLRPGWDARLAEAIAATERGRADVVDADYVERIVFPEMGLLLRLADQRERFNEALARAVADHQRYWSAPERARSPTGYLALGPLALAAMAHDRGLAVEVDSDYLPMELVRGSCR